MSNKEVQVYVQRELSNYRFYCTSDIDKLLMEGLLLMILHKDAVITISLKKLYQITLVRKTNQGIQLFHKLVDSIVPFPDVPTIVDTDTPVTVDKFVLPKKATVLSIWSLVPWYNCFRYNKLIPHGDMLPYRIKILCRGVLIKDTVGIPHVCLIVSYDEESAVGTADSGEKYTNLKPISKQELCSYI